MPQKKAWTEEEDKVLRHLFEIEKISKWSKIAQKMADDYKMTGRNGKQCRERYQSVLEPSFFHLLWTEDEEKLMYTLHNQLGNKWAQIAQRMPGRTDNCVKNHFYSNFRKAIRKLNKTISENFKSQIKQIRPIVLYKIIEATDEHFKLAPSIRDDIPLNCTNIKSKLLQYSSDNCQFENDLVQLKLLAQEIQTFSKDYKRKPKKDRRGVAQSLNLMKVPKIDKFKCASDVEDDSDMSIQVSERDSIHMGQKNNEEEQQKKPLIVHKLKQVIEVSKNSLRMSKQEEQQDNRGIQLLLKNAGILFDGNQSGYNPFFKQSISESNVSEIRDKNEGFNLGESMEKFKHSFILRQSGEIDEDLRLFQST